MESSQDILEIAGYDIAALEQGLLLLSTHMITK
jgi:hypothetical protein